MKEYTERQRIRTKLTQKVDMGFVALAGSLQLEGPEEQRKNNEGIRRNTQGYE